jgi:hypothetical protein
LPVANGGTGAGSLTTNSVLLGGTNALQEVAPGTSGNVLTSDGTTWTSTAAPGIASGTATGDMLYWNGTAWVKVTAGTNGQTLAFYNGAPVWTSSTSSSTPSVLSSTGRIWMDRNLGATQVATSSNDAASFGDMYQWGRGTDGHQLRTSTKVSTQSINDAPDHANFINGYPNWRNPTNDNLWQGVNGINNPCPSSYRIPTKAELDAEVLLFSSPTAAGAFASVLKLPASGYRSRADGSINDTGRSGGSWSSTVNGGAHALYFWPTGAETFPDPNAQAHSVRCIKD